MEILIRTMALAAGVHMAPNVTVLPPQPTGPGLAARSLGRALQWLGRGLVRAGATLVPPPAPGPDLAEPTERSGRFPYIARCAQIS